MTAAALLEQSRGMWNPRGSVPLHQWLVAKQEASDRRRLAMLGNIVIPQCARLALHIFVHQIQSRDH